MTRATRASVRSCIDLSGRGRLISISAGGMSAEHLRVFLERIERPEGEKRSIAEDLKEGYCEANGADYDVKILRRVASIRKQDRDERREEEEVLDLCLSALGMHS